MPGHAPFRPQPVVVDFRAPWRKHVEQQAILCLDGEYMLHLWGYSNQRFDDGIPERGANTAQRDSLAFHRDAKGNKQK